MAFYKAVLFINIVLGNINTVGRWKYLRSDRQDGAADSEDVGTLSASSLMHSALVLHWQISFRY